MSTLTYATRCVAILLVTCFLSCEKKIGDSKKKLQVGLQGVQTIRDNIAPKTDVDPLLRYLSDRYDHTLSVFGDGKTLDGKPHLISATIYFKVVENGVAPSLRIEWLEEGFDVSGIRIVSENTTVDYPNAFVWGGDDKKWFASTAWRDTWLAIVNAPDTVWKGDPTDWKCLVVPDAVLKEGAQVELLTRDGKQSNRVSLYVPRHPSLTR